MREVTGKRTLETDRNTENGLEMEGVGRWTATQTIEHNGNHVTQRVTRRGGAVSVDGALQRLVSAVGDHGEILLQHLPSISCVVRNYAQR